MNKRSCLSGLIAIALWCSLQTAAGTVYYVDSISGNNQFTGLSPNQAWLDLEKINHTRFLPGDSILFKCGTSYSGSLEIQHSGTTENPIVVGMYGNGNKPAIHGKGKKIYTVLLNNAEHIIVQDLEISNTGTEREKGRTGVLVLAENCGDRRNITLQRLTVRDVNGSLVKKEGGGSGILWENRGDSIRSRFIHLHIKNCHLINCSRNGIISNGYSNRDNWYPSKGILIRDNLLEGIPGDGIVPIGCDGAVIEHNIMRNCPDILSHEEAAAGIWPWSCDNTVIQYNDVSGHNAKWDGQGFDSDYNCLNTTIQYNYSHDNAGGFLLICNDGGSLGKGWNIGTENTVIRYNISVNDGLREYPTTQAGWFSPVIHITGPVKNTQIYNNTIIIKVKNKPEIDKTIVKMDNWGEKWPENTSFYNNYFYVTEDADAGFDFGAAIGTTFFNNVYVGKILNQPKDAIQTP